jgi:IS30 family transposase
MDVNIKSYKKLLPEDRKMIASLKRKKYSIQLLAEILELSTSTVNKKLSCNKRIDTYSSVRQRNEKYLEIMSNASRQFALGPK